MFTTNTPEITDVAQDIVSIGNDCINFGNISVSCSDIFNYHSYNQEPDKGIDIVKKYTDVDCDMTDVYLIARINNMMLKNLLSYLSVHDNRNIKYKLYLYLRQYNVKLFNQISVHLTKLEKEEDAIALYKYITFMFSLCTRFTLYIEDYNKNNKKTLSTPSPKQDKERQEQKNNEYKGGDNNNEKMKQLIQSVFVPKNNNRTVSNSPA